MTGCRSSHSRANAARLGEWKRPAGLCFVKDRLYLVEEGHGRGHDGNLIYPLRGRRIFVLSLQGETLQVYTHSRAAPGPFVDPLTFWDLCYFDGKLRIRLKWPLRFCGHWPSVGVKVTNLSVVPLLLNVPLVCPPKSKSSEDRDYSGEPLGG